MTFFSGGKLNKLGGKGSLFRTGSKTELDDNKSDAGTLVSTVSVTAVLIEAQSRQSRHSPLPITCRLRDFALTCIADSTNSAKGSRHTC